MATDRRRTGVKTVLPRLLLKFSVIVLVVMLTGSLYTYYQVDSKVHTAQERNNHSLATGAVAGLSDMIVVRDYTHLQQTLEQLMANDALTNAVVTDPNGKVLSEVKRTATGTEPVFNDELIQTPSSTENIVSTKDSSAHKIILWAKIDANYHVGWIRMELSTQREDDLLQNLNATLIMTFVVMVVLLGILVGSEFKKTYQILHQHEQKIYDAAHYDSLTKLPNRLALEPMIQKMYNNANKYNTPLAVAFLDLDGFKEINDTHGHATGDKLLFQVAMRIRAMLRDDDAVVRIGGDEFVLLLNEIAPADVEPLLNRVITEVNEQYDILVGGEVKHLNVGASIGVTNYPEDKSAPTELLAHADSAMYDAKALGKNQISVYKQQVSKH